MPRRARAKEERKPLDSREWVREQLPFLPRETAHSELLLILQTYADDNHVAYPGHALLAKQLHRSEKWVAHLLHELADEPLPPSLKGRETRWGRFGLLRWEKDAEYDGKRLRHLYMLRLDRTLDPEKQAQEQWEVDSEVCTSSEVQRKNQPGRQPEVVEDNETRPARRRPEVQTSDRPKARRKRPGGRTVTVKG